MKLSYEWLKEYVDIDASAEEIARMLTMSGSAVESVKDVEGTKVFELEITSNRPDCLNVLGLARETAAIFEKKLKTPRLGTLEGGKSDVAPKCVIEAMNFCFRYTARVITGVKVKPSKNVIAVRLSSVGLRPINNIVDITNYCLMELGQPMHAFDLDKIKGGKVIVREAMKGEKIVTIDGAERTLEEGMLVIADAERAIAIAGVMGGKDTEVTASTKNILLESAYFNPIFIRRTARKLALSTDSSYRFERGVDKGMVKLASDRAAKMILAQAGGKAGDFLDEGNAEAKKVEIGFDIDRAEKILGVQLGKTQVKRIFKSLGIAVKKGKEKELCAAIPSFRGDIDREIDLIEEVARVFGYDNIPSTVSKIVPQGERKEKQRKVDEKVRMALAGLGMNEIITYSLTNKRSAEMFSSTDKVPVQLANPLSEEQKYLVPQLVDGMLKAVSWNINRKNKDLAFFEIAKTYHRTGAGEKDIKEVPALSIGMTGNLRKNWKEGDVAAGLYDLKGAVESLFAHIRVAAEFVSAEKNGFSVAAEIKIGPEKRSAGFIGEVSAKTLAAYDIIQKVFIAEIVLDETAKAAVLEDSYMPVPRFPTSSRDVSILCDKSLESAALEAAMEEKGGSLLKRVDLLDLYEGEKLPAGKKSLTYTLDYGRDDRTITDDEVEAVHAGIKQAIAEKFGVTYR